jgi:hypothetical protein
LEAVAGQHFDEGVPVEGVFVVVVVVVAADACFVVDFVAKTKDKVLLHFPPFFSSCSSGFSSLAFGAPAENIPAGPDFEDSL